MNQHFCPFCGFLCLSKSGLSQHISSKPNCLAKHKTSAGLTAPPPAKKKKAPVAAEKISVKSVSFEPFRGKVVFLSSKNRRQGGKKRNAASIEEVEADDLLPSATDRRGEGDDDWQLVGSCSLNPDQVSAGQDDDWEDNRKMPAKEPADQDLSDGDEGQRPGWVDQDAYFEAEAARDLAQSREEVRAFMENNNVPLQPTLAHAWRQQQHEEALAGLLDDNKL